MVSTGVNTTLLSQPFSRLFTYVVKAAFPYPDHETAEEKYLTGHLPISLKDNQIDLTRFASSADKFNAIHL